MFSTIKNAISNLFIRWLTEERPPGGLPLCDFERIRYEIRPGDVLLIEGRSRVSDIIRSITQSSWSHSALYIGRLHDVEDPRIRNLIASHYNGSPDTQLIIEGLMGQGTVVMPLTSYEKDHIRLCRPRGLSRQDAQHVINFAARKLGHDYDVRQVLDLARFLLPWTFFPTRYRSKLFESHAGESTKTVCSSMMAEAFGSVDFPILPLVKQKDSDNIELIIRNPRLFTPRDFDYSPYFDIIKYPFVEFADYAMYRRLPWNRDGLISHDKVGVHPKHVAVIPPKTEKTWDFEKNATYKKFKAGIKKKLTHKKKDQEVDHDKIAEKFLAEIHEENVKKEDSEHQITKKIEKQKIKNNNKKLENKLEINLEKSFDAKLDTSEPRTK
jgi:hypothetical protein